MRTIPERLTQLQIIECAEREEKEFTDEAMRRYNERAEQSQMWRTVIWYLVLGGSLAVAVLWSSWRARQ